MLKRLFAILIATLFLANFANAEERIKMTSENGVYTIPCEVNGVPLRFIIDTGASMVSISMTEARFMYKNGYIDENDFIGTAKTRIANGDLEENMKLNLKEVKVGNKTLNNVEALVSKSSNAPLLLGQSVLRQLGIWYFDNDYFVIKECNGNDNDKYDKTFERLKKLPKEANRLYKLALQYLNSGNNNKAIENFNKAAKNYWIIGNFENSYLCAKKSADLGDAEGQNSLGCYYNRLQNYKKAVFWWKKSAEQGDAKAQSNLAVCYYSGNGVTQSNEQAIYWWKKSAWQGCDYGQFSLGLRYYNGEGITQNYKQAVYWFKEAANQGFADAQLKLGVCYRKGYGVAQDDQKAVYWFKKAADQGLAEAQFSLGCYYHVAQSYQQAAYWYKKAAMQGRPDAQFNLGICYVLFDDYQQVVYWWKKAANQGHADAQYYLGKCYFKGKGVSQSYQQAIYWLKKAAEKGQSSAKTLYYLSICLLIIGSIIIVLMLLKTINMIKQ